MISLTDIFNRRAARIDAQLGLESRGDRTLVALGAQPKLDTKNPEHARWLFTLSQNHKREELREDIAQVEDELAKHESSLFLGIQIVVALGIETLGAVLLMKVLGLSPAERLPLAFGLAIALIGLTAAATHYTVSGQTPAASKDPSRAELTANLLAKLRRSAITMVILIAYALFVGAVTVIRIMSAAADSEGTLVEIVAQGVLMLATAIGPSFWAESLVRRRTPIRALEKYLSRRHRRLKIADREHERAQTQVDDMSRRTARWEADAARLGALYASEHRREVARKAETPIDP